MARGGEGASWRGWAAKDGPRVWGSKEVLLTAGKTRVRGPSWAEECWVLDRWEPRGSGWQWWGGECLLRWGAGRPLRATPSLSDTELRTLAR